MTASGDGAFYTGLIAADPHAFAQALSQAGIGMWFNDVDDDIVNYNEYLLDAFGLDGTEGLSNEAAMMRFVHPDDIARTRATATKQVAAGRPIELSHRLLHSNGRYVPCVTFVAFITDETGEHVRRIGIIRDQDELERAKSGMRDAEIMAGLGQWRVDIATDKMSWSDGMFHIYGYEPDSFVPDREWARNRIVASDRERVTGIVEAAREAGGSIDYRTRILARSGDERHVKVIGEVEFGANGEPLAYSGIIEDTTEEVMREAQIRQAQKMEAIGSMTGGAAHDFNNLLAVILGNLELLRERVDEDELMDYCDAAITAALNGAELTKGMLSFARQAQLDPTTVDLNALVSGLDRWTRRTLPANIETEVSLMAGLWKTEIDSSSAESTMLNLILNARDAMPDGGKLTIETANVRIDDDYIATRREDVEPGRYIMVAVSDTGNGIASDIVDQIFEPFFTTKRTDTASGLGLSMVQGFVRQSSGAIRVYTEPGVGTTFKLYFPAMSSGEPRHAQRHGVQVTGALAGARILLAEDGPYVREVLIDTLTGAGFDVTAARSGDEAKAIFEQDPNFDLLLTDIVMPGRLQGTALVHELRSLRPSLPAIFMSGYANEATVHGNGLRPEDIRLMKPVRRSDLLAAIEKALSIGVPDD